MVLKRLMIATAAMGLACGAAGAWAQEHVDIQPAAQTFKVGAFEVIPLRDAAMAMPNNGKVFGLNTTPAEIAAVLAAAGAPTDKIRLDVDAVLVKTPGHVVLIDTGLGPMAHGLLLQSLALTGVAPGDVTDVLITHAHGDHVGGLLDAQGALAFPKATIRMSTKEWAFLQSQDRMKAMATAIAPQVKTFEPGQPILPGITPVALYGHTPGQAGYEITSRGQSLFDMGDIAHSSIVSLAKPEWTIMFDGDKEGAASLRRTELKTLAASHQLIFAPHFPYPGVGWIEVKGDGFSFKPDVASAK